MSAPKIMWLQSPSPSQSQQQQPLERCVGDNQLTSWPSLSSYSYTYVYMAFKISITIRNTFLHVFNFGIFTVNARRRRPQWRRPLNAFKWPPTMLSNEDGHRRDTDWYLIRTNWLSTDVWQEMLSIWKMKQKTKATHVENTKNKKLPSILSSDASSTRQL